MVALRWTGSVSEPHGLPRDVGRLLCKKNERKIWARQILDFHKLFWGYRTDRKAVVQTSNVLPSNPDSAKTDVV